MGRKRLKKTPTRGDLQHKLLDIATEVRPEVAVTSRRLAALSRYHGEEVYSRFIHLVSHLEFPPEEAKAHWQAIARHTSTMTRRLRRSVDFRVGVADYFVHESPQIKYPKVIDFEVFNETEKGTFKDDLTGLYNFRFLKEALPREINKASRLGMSLSLVFLDVDDFKGFNDRYGHEAGNAALNRIAATLRESIRTMDIPCRYGGEEFAVLLPATDKFASLQVAERMVRNVEMLRLPPPKDEGSSLTISAGVASFPADADTAEELVRAADKAMYRAKAGGKNLAVPYSTERRAYPRENRSFAGTCMLPQRPSFSITGSNLSQSGLYFVCGTELYHGQTLDLSLDFSANGIRKIACKGRVAWCEPLSSRKFGVGSSITYIRPTDRLRFYEALTHSKRGRSLSRRG